MPGTMSIFAEALARQTGSGLTGQAALAALYEAVPTGKVKAADILPIVSQIMSERAAPKIEALRNTSMAQQARLGNALQDWVDTFSKNGGEEGFARVFRTLTGAVERLTPMIKGLSEAFNWFTKQLEGPIVLLGDMGYHFSNIKNTLDNLNPNIMKFAALGGLLMTKWGRIASVFYGLYMVLEDISVGIMGGESLTGKFFTFLEKFVQFDKGIMGVAMAFLAVAGALKIAGAVAKASMLGSILRDSLPGGTPDIPGKGKPTSPGAGWMRMLGGPLVALASYWGMNQEDFKLRYNQDYDFREEVDRFTGRLAGPAFTGLGELLGTYTPNNKGKGYVPSDGSDIPSVPTGPEQAMSQMGMTSNTSNSIQNTFQINIEGVIDPANMENVFNEQILPQVEGWWTNQLGEVNTSFGSK